MRAVLDTNVVVSALIWGGKPFALLQAATDSDLLLYTSAALLVELREVLERPHLAARLERQRSSVDQALTYYAGLAGSVTPDATPRVVSADAETRGRAFDALTNAATGIERFIAAQPAARQTLAHRINSVKVAEGGKPTIAISGQTLLVSFVPGEGHEGHASSLAIQMELSKLLAASAKDIATK